MPRNWENEFLWVMGAKGKSFIFITKRIAWGATIYHLWRHRNSRIHENEYSSEDTIFHLICNDVRLKVSGLIIMLTELGVRGGPSLSLSLACVETILVIDGHLHWCGPDTVGSLGALAWPLGGSLFVFPVPEMWACCLVLFAYPGLWGFCLVVLLVVPVCGCWVLFFRFYWLFVFVVPVCG